jgi:MFS family permease
MSNAIRLTAGLVVFVLALVVYILTIAPTVALVDSGELTDAAWSLGNAHPPGFPLFLLLTHPFTRLPFGSVAWGCNLASAVFSAAASGFVALAVGEMLLLPVTGIRDGRKKKRGRKQAEPVPTPFVVIALIMIAAGLLFAFSKTLWAYATETEVYALNSAMMAAVAWLMLLWARTRSNAVLYAAALLFGLALGVHHVTIGLTAAAIAVLLTRTAGFSIWRSRRALVGALLICAGLLVYLYIPIAAAHAPAMNWGNPSTARRVWGHITAEAYRAYLSPSSESLSAQIDRYVRYLIHELGPSRLPLALLIAAVGFVTLWRRQRTLFLYVILLLLADFAWVVFYPVKNDQDAYVIPSFLALVFAFAYGAKRVSELGREQRWQVALAAAMLIAPIVALATAYPLRDRSRFWVARDYTTNALQAMRSKALLITGDWEMYSPMRYVLDVEKSRADVAVIETGFLFSDWYHEELERRYPEVMRGCRAESRAVLASLRRFDAQHSLWADANARSELNYRVDDLLMALIAQQLKRGPVYLTVDTALTWDQRDANFIHRLSTDSDIVPGGIVAEVLPGHAFRDLKPAPILTRGLLDGTVHYEADDVVPTEILPKYRAAFLMRARYFVLLRRLPEALADYRQALALDPDNRTVRGELAAVEARAR